MRSEQPKIYHIVHIDRLPSIIADGYIWSDAIVTRSPRKGTAIGLKSIKLRRLSENFLKSHPDLTVGHCTPFYFCPRSVMLYIIYQANHPELVYRGGQKPIVHLVADLYKTVEWAEANCLRWAFTLSNAGSSYFEDHCRLKHLDDINWDAVEARRWSGGGVDNSIKEGKQAEFLIENQFSWSLVETIGVLNMTTSELAATYLRQSTHKPKLEVVPEWYY